MWPGYAGTTMNLKIFLKENLNNQYLNQATQKSPEWKMSNPRKSFNHPCHLKSRVPSHWSTLRKAMIWYIFSKFHFVDVGVVLKQWAGASLKIDGDTVYFSQKYSSYGDWKRPIKAFDQLYEDFCFKMHKVCSYYSKRI